MSKLVERFLKYVKIDTQSDENSTTSPSTEKQWDLLKLLKEELAQLNIQVELSEFGYVYAFLPANFKTDKSIGFLAHVDTSPDASDENVKPRIIEKYNGEKIQLNEKWSMDTNTFESLKKVIGDDIIVTDGNTLLGADDKAGVSEIMELCAYYVTNPKVPHVNIYICFTPDEEIGNGTLHIDLNKFKPDFAYTVDGGDVSCIEYETFNAASATVEIFGKSVHPGYAKNKMVNASLVLYEFHALLPKKMQPQFTENYEGFNHLTSVNGSCEYAKSTYIIRNHDKEKFNAQKELFPQVAATLNAKYGYEIAKVTIKDQYYNMGDVIKDRMETIEIPKQACKNIGLEPYTEPIRGGTDGSKLTYMGIICPNLGGGGFNFHGRYEFCSINQMEKALLLLKEIVHLVSVEN